MTFAQSQRTGVKVVVQARPALFLETLTRALIAKGHLVQAATADVLTASAIAPRLGPNLCLFDGAEAGPCLEAARWLHERLPDVKVLVLSAASAPTIQRAYESHDVDAVVDRNCVFDQLDAALMRAVRGDRCLEEGPPLPAREPAPAAALTKRERQVLECLVRGAMTYAIAEELHISAHTVRMHVHGLMHKLDVHTRSRAVSVALARGLLEDGHAS